MNVRLIDAQLMNPPVVTILRNQPNTVAEPARIFMNASKRNTLQERTAARGSPAGVQRAQNLGACPRKASPYKMRELQKRKELPAENAEVKTMALMMEGNALMPERVIAMTKGD